MKNARGAVIEAEEDEKEIVQDQNNEAKANPLKELENLITDLELEIPEFLALVKHPGLTREVRENDSKSLLEELDNAQKKLKKVRGGKNDLRERIATLTEFKKQLESIHLRATL